MYLNKELIERLKELVSICDRTNSIADAIGMPEELKIEFLLFTGRMNELLHGIPDSNPGEGKGSFKNYGIKALLVRNFRKYGQILSNPDAYYGMELKDSGLTVLLGDNGSGKSSVFDAAEYLFTGNIGEAEYRDYNVNSFVRRNTSEHEIIAKFHNGVVIGTEETKMPDEIKSLPLSNFFISENSIYQSGKMIEGDNFLPYFCELLGLGDIYRFINGTPMESDSILNKVNQYLMTKVDSLKMKPDEVLDKLRMSVIDFERPISDQDRNELLKRLNYIKQIYKEWLSISVDDFDINEELKKANKKAYLYLVPEFRDWMTFSKDLKDRNPITSTRSRSFREALERRSAIANFDKEKAVANMKSHLKLLIDNIEKLLSLESSEIMLHSIVDLAVKYDNMRKSQLPDGVNDDVKDGILNVPKQLKTAGENVMAALESYVSGFMDENFVLLINSLFKESFLSESESITIGKIENHTLKIEVNGVSINKYFNTFRYRLFFLIMQSAICLRMMENNKVVFPIMLDDIFYANDYHNKTELCKFFNEVIKESNRIFDNEVKPQIIFLSHDEQLVMSMYQKGMDADYIVEYGKLLNIKNIEEMELTKRTIDVTEAIKYEYRNIYIHIYK